MKKSHTLYVIAQRMPYSSIDIFDECVFETKAEAEAEKANTLKLYKDKGLALGNLEIMTVEEYIWQYGEDRYNQGSIDERYTTY
jgi:hypothetical protein